jgi:hypothetical protein
MIVSLSFSFVKTIKTKSGIRLNLFLHLALPILHQPLRRYRSLSCFIISTSLITETALRIISKNKDAYSTAIIDIADEDVISFVTKRGNQEKPQITCLDILAGDTTQLQSRIKDYLINFHDSKWSCEASIDNLPKYNLTLQSKIRIQTKIYAITELERNYIDDEYKVKAWLL